MNRPGVEVQDIFQSYGANYIKSHRPPPHVQKVIRAIANCRTAIMGGHTDYCEDCGYSHTSYNSCRNRHCPKCQALSKERWIMARQEELLPVPYFHVVFTLPFELNSIVLQNQEVMYNLLFKASQETIRELALDKKYLGGQIGLTSILHTWGQNLMLHPHVHMIVPGGGLTPDAKWNNSRKKFFIPVKVMARKFRGKFLHYLENANLDFQGSMTYLKDAQQFHNLIVSLFQKDWYVYCKRPFKTTNSVLEYLGRYTHRIAISNHRIISCENRQVSFLWRDYHDSSKQKVMTLSADEFMRRFLLHVLPPGFTKIRHYGFLASAVKSIKLDLCKKLTGSDGYIRSEVMDTVLLIKELTGINITVCPICGHTLSRASPETATA